MSKGPWIAIRVHVLIKINTAMDLLLKGLGITLYSVSYVDRIDDKIWFMLADISHLVDTEEKLRRIGCTTERYDPAEPEEAEKNVHGLVCARARARRRFFSIALRAIQDGWGPATEYFWMIACARGWGAELKATLQKKKERRSMRVEEDDALYMNMKNGERL
jgi:hypothetical protein